MFAAFAGALSALLSGVEAILGSFMAGMIFGQVFKSKGRFEEKINALGFGFLTPFFFIGIGAEFDISLLKSPDLLKLAVFLTAMTWLGKSPPRYSSFLKWDSLLKMHWGCLFCCRPPFHAGGFWNHRVKNGVDRQYPTRSPNPDRIDFQPAVPPLV